MGMLANKVEEACAESKVTARERVAPLEEREHNTLRSRRFGKALPCGYLAAKELSLVHRADSVTVTPILPLEVASARAKQLPTIVVIDAPVKKTFER